MTDNMDNILTQLLAFPPHPSPSPPLTDGEYDKQAKSLVQSLSKIQPDHLTEPVKGNGSLLEVLNPSINSISYLHVLSAHIYKSNDPTSPPAISEEFALDTPLWEHTTKFLTSFDPVQIRYTGNRTRQLIEVTAQRAIATQKPAAAIAPVRTAILRIDPDGSTFTSSHVIFSRLCLLAQAYDEALPLLDKPVYHFPPQTTKASESTADSLAAYLCSSHESSSTYINTVTGLTNKLEYQDHLKYFLYGAMIYMALKVWDQAIFYLEAVLISPTANTASKIQLEAYKKWVLVSLLRKGKVGPTPRTTNSHALKLLQNLSKPYAALSAAFAKGISNEENSSGLLTEVQTGQGVWQEDCNGGLVQQVVLAYREFSIRRLEKTYAALTVPDIAKRTSPDPTDLMETGHYIIKLISTDKLNATIAQPSEDPSTWILRFGAALEEDESSGMLLEEQEHEDLTREMENIQALMVHVKEATRKYGLSKEYIQELKAIKKGKQAANGPEGESWAPPEEAFDQDEDMMAD